MGNKEKINEENLENAEDFLDIKDSKAKPIIITIIIILLLGGLIGVGIWQKDTIINFYKELTSEENKKEEIKIKDKEYSSEYRMNGNSLEKFDLYFLKLENNNKNMVYSPLSIKYALAMLKEGASEGSKEQLAEVIGEYKAKKYNNNDNMSFANAMFVRDTFKDKVKNEYLDTLSNKYNASVIYDNFSNTKNINKWVSEKTLKLIPDLVTDDNIKDANFYLINALAVNMKWKNNIQCTKDSIMTDDCKWDSYMYKVSYAHEKYYNDFITAVDGRYSSLTFNDLEKVKAVEIGASINNYNIVKEVGEEKIRKVVGDAYESWLNGDGEFFRSNPSLDGSGLDRDDYLDRYIEMINDNYGKNYSSTDFLMYIDENIKAFGKDLKEYDGVSLQYVGIMPQKESLEKFIQDMDVSQIKKYINQLKSIKNNNFKDGVITKIKGFLPLFKVDYQLDLVNDLKSLGIENVFDSEKADLSGISDEKEYIFDASHKTNFEFSTEGIKATSVTSVGGAGGSSGGEFQYDFDVPVEEIDISFDKPFLYLIRDKKSGEIWFMGTIYEPIMIE